MDEAIVPGQIIILNGAPRSGKSSTARAIQDSFEGVWLNLGADFFMRATPQKYHPGVGLRPGEEGHHVYALTPLLFAAAYDAIAAVSRAGVNVVSLRGARLLKPSTRFFLAQRPASMESSAVTLAPRATLVPPVNACNSASAKT